MNLLEKFVSGPPGASDFHHRHTNLSWTPDLQFLSLCDKNDSFVLFRNVKMSSISFSKYLKSDCHFEQPCLSPKSYP